MTDDLGSSLYEAAVTLHIKIVYFSLCLLILFWRIYGNMRRNENALTRELSAIKCNSYMLKCERYMKRAFPRKIIIIVIQVRREYEQNYTSFRCATCNGG